MEHAKTVYYSIIAGISAGGGIVATLLGGWDDALKVLTIIVAIDYISGILCALIWKKSPKSDGGAFESKASIKGLFRKISYFACVLVGVCLDKLTGTDFLRDTIIIFFIANDGFSIIENLGIMGVPIPQKLRKAFVLLNDKAENDS